MQRDGGTHEGSGDRKNGQEGQKPDAGPASENPLRRKPPVIEGEASEVAGPVGADAVKAGDETVAAKAEPPPDSPAAESPETASAKPRRSLAAPVGIAAGALVVAGGLAWVFSDQLIPPPASPPAVAAKPPAPRPEAKPEPLKPAPLKPEAPKSEPPKTDAAKTDAARTDAARTDAARVEPAKPVEAAKPPVLPQPAAPPAAAARPPVEAQAQPKPAAPAPAAATDPRLSAALDRIDALTARLDQIAARVEAGEKAAVTAVGAVRGMEALGPKIEAMGQRLAALEQKLDQPKADVRAPEQREAGAGHAAESLGARAVAAQTASQNLAAGRPVGPAAAALGALGVEPQRLAPFEPFLTTAPPTVGRLAEEWRALRPKILAEPVPRGAWYESLVAKATNLVKIRPLGDVAGASAAAVYARVETALARGDLAAATEAADALPAPAKEAAAGWRQAAGRLRAAQEAARALANESMSALGRARS